MLRILSGVFYICAVLTSAIAKGVYEPIHNYPGSRQITARQASPTTTNSTDCPANDGLFYITAHNYTFQIQCATTYVQNSEQILTQTAPSFTACISQCASYNRNNSSSSSFCIGINFNAETDDSTGDCTLFDEISPVPNQASEEGSIEDAALLVYGPSGQVFATPEMEPSNVVGGILTNSLVFSSQPSVLLSGSSVSASTTIVTSTFASTASASFSSSAQMISISLDGVRPLTPSSQLPSSTGSGAAIITASSNSPPYVTLQATQTSILPFTEYRIMTVVSCVEEPTTTSCTTSASTQIISGLRTEISCSPGTCLGVMLATGTTAGMSGVFTGECIVQSF